MSEILEFLSRTPEGLAWDRMAAELQRQLRNPTPEFASELKAMGQELNAIRTLTPGAVSSTPVLQTLAVAYRNDELVGTRVMPVVNTVSDLGLDDGKLAATYWSATKRDAYDDGPDDTMATRATANEIEQTFSRTDVSLQPRALSRFIDAWTQAAMDPVVRRMVNAVVSVSNVLGIRQERRIAAIAGAAGSFGSNTTAIAAADRWDSAGGGNPKAIIDAAKSSCVSTGPGRWVGLINESVYNVLKIHPLIIDAFKYTRGGGFIPRQLLADYFELDELVVGRSQYTSTAEGQTTQTQTGIWPSVFGVYRVQALPSVETMCFGVTIETPRFVSNWFVNGDGGRGGYKTQVAFADLSVVISTDAGYLVTTPIG